MADRFVRLLHGTARQHEDEVGEAIQVVPNRLAHDLPVILRAQRVAFGASHHGAGQVERGLERRRAWHQEDRLERMLLGQLVDDVLDRRDESRFDE